MINESSMTLATDWRGSDISGWFVSEKLNGCRAYWDGHQFWTRGGNVIKAPRWFTRGLPTVPLDGEIWAGRNGFEIARKAVQYGGDWFNDGLIEFVAFDLPGMVGRWDERIREASKSLRRSAHHAIEFFQIAPDCRDYLKLVEFMAQLRPLGGEGVCMRNPDVTSYETGRSTNLLRFKFCND